MYSIKIENIDEYMNTYKSMYNTTLINPTEKERKKIKDEKRTGKGIKKCVLNNEIKHADFDECLTKQTTFNHQMNLIKSNAHQLYTVNISKTSLSSYDNKRYILDNGYDCLSYGHYKINETNNI